MYMTYTYRYDLYIQICIYPKIGTNYTLLSPIYIHIHYIHVGIFSWLIVYILVVINHIHNIIQGQCKTIEDCVNIIIYRLIIISVLLCVYICIILYISRIYEVRLLEFLGVRSSDEYRFFLEFSVREEKRIEQQHIILGMYITMFKCIVSVIICACMCNIRVYLTPTHVQTTLLYSYTIQIHATHIQV